METLRGDFKNKQNSPTRSGFYATPNAYLNDKNWIKIAPAFCEGISMMPVVRDYPDWWIVMTPDGFEYNLEPAALIISSNHKHFLVKEEGDTSKACQTYDQHVSK